MRDFGKDPYPTKGSIITSSADSPQRAFIKYANSGLSSPFLTPFVAFFLVNLRRNL